MDVNAISLENGGDGSTYAVRFETELTVTTGGNYTFTTRSDDGSQLFVNGVLVVDNDGLHGARTRTGSINLGAGDHDVVIIFFENSGSDNLSSTISGPDTGGSAIDLTTADIANPGLAAGPGVAGNDVIDGGDGDDFIDAGGGDDTQTGGVGDDTFIEVAGDGVDTITDFNAGNSGAIDDGDQTNNDFVDLSGFYNATSLADVNAAGGDFASELGMLRADAADGQLDGVIDGVDYSAQIGDVDLILENGGATVTGLDLTFDNTNVACFTAGTLIDTHAGPVEIDHLRVGDLVLTSHNGFQPICWIGKRTLNVESLRQNPKLRPIRFAAHSLGQGLPKRDLCVSPQHRIVVSSRIAARVCGDGCVFVHAHKLLGLPGVSIVCDANSVTYLHIMFDQHQVVFAEGAPSESLYLGAQTLRSLSREAILEITQIFPGLMCAQGPRPALPMPSGRLQKKITARHFKNKQPILQTWV